MFSSFYCTSHLISLATHLSRCGLILLAVFWISLHLSFTRRTHSSISFLLFQISSNDLQKHWQVCMFEVECPLFWAFLYVLWSKLPSCSVNWWCTWWVLSSNGGWALLQVKCNCKNGLVLFKRERWVLLELKMGFWSILGHCMRKFKKWCRNMEEVNKLSSRFEASKAGFWKWIRNLLSCALYLFDKKLFWCLCIWRLVLQIPYVKNISCSLLGRAGGPYLQRTAWRK